MFCKNKLWEILAVETWDTPTDFLFVLVVRVYFEKNVLYSNVLYSKNHGQIKINLTSSQFTECVQNQVLNQMQHQVFTFLLSPIPFYIISN